VPTNTPNPPDLDGFGSFVTPAGQAWNLTATALSGDGTGTNDQGCVAVAHHPDGRVALADTKQALADQTPMVFLAEEWSQFTQAVRDGRV
jgi:hypothetical protein